MKQADNKKLCEALNNAMNLLRQSNDAPISIILREYGYTSIPRSFIESLVEMNHEPFTEDNIEEARVELRRIASEKNKQRRDTKIAQLAAIADKPLPLAKVRGEGLEKYQPCELIAELRRRGYSGKLYYTKVTEVCV